MSALILLALVIIGLLLFIVVVGGIFMIMLKLGVIAREARRPPTLDRGTYRLDQAREVGREDAKD